jgi:hypothetical protein
MVENLFVNEIISGKYYREPYNQIVSFVFVYICKILIHVKEHKVNFFC